MAITLVAQVTAGPGSSGGASSAIDTTGADLLVLSLSWYDAFGSPTVSDAKGNTWTPLTARNNGWHHRLYYVKNASVGAGHTFTVAAGYPAFIVHAFAGSHLTAPFDGENGATGGTPGPVAAGSVTPSVNGALVLTGFSSNATTGVTVSGGLTQTTKAAVGGVCVFASTGYLVQTTAAAINPAWSIGGGSDTIAVGIAAFKPAAAPAAVARADPFVIMPI